MLMGQGGRAVKPAGRHAELAANLSGSLALHFIATLGDEITVLVAGRMTHVAFASLHVIVAISSPIVSGTISFNGPASS
jgi:hypothetical protein